EIGEMPIALQPKLLRAIESRQIRRVGSSTSRTVNVRIVAATNRSLASSLNEGSFREDLYYRLAVVELRLPALRARRDDIPVLAAHFYRMFVGDQKQLPAEFVASLVGRGWPGNVRELRNYIERAVSLGTVTPRLPAPGTAESPLPGAPGTSWPPGSIESFIALHLPLKEARKAWTESFELVYVRTMLKMVGGNVTRAAERAGVSRRFLQRMVARLGIVPSEITDAGDGGDDDAADGDED
ncbi:MAG TPA: sigma 54-interacting transcriptional regulator, partial [Kofleriaceae bacterium]